MPISYFIQPGSAYLVRHADFNPTPDRFSAPRLMPSNTRLKNELSKKAKKSLKTATNWISFLSRERDVNFQNGNSYKGFRLSFVTLTLPGKQMHTHSEIVSRCLNQFLIRLRAKYGISNYVWKAELQENGNIHFHLILDRYINWKPLRYIWNQCINLLGYVSRYRETMEKLDFDEYCYWRYQTGNPRAAAVKKAWKYGKETNWQSPNTTDVHSVKKVKDLVAYVSKYLSKDIAKKKTGPIADSIEELTGRLWYCSQSLSKLKRVKVPVSFDNRRYARLLRNCSKVLSIEVDFCELFFFRIPDLPFEVRRWFLRVLWRHAQSTGYAIP